MNQETTSARIIPLISYQPAALYYLYCRDCGYEMEMMLPTTMYTQAVQCCGCEKRGLMVGHPVKYG